jgi:hypothetical protein
MRFRTILTLATLLPAVLVFAAVGCLYHLATQSGSDSGEISGVAAVSFSVDVQQSQEPATLKFLIDDTTKIEGRLKVEATAPVDYRTEDVNNIAVRVVVHPAASSQ